MARKPGRERDRPARWPPLQRHWRRHRWPPRPWQSGLRACGREAGRGVQQVVAGDAAAGQKHCRTGGGYCAVRDPGSLRLIPPGRLRGRRRAERASRPQKKKKKKKVPQIRTGTPALSMASRAASTKKKPRGPCRSPPYQTQRPKKSRTWRVAGSKRITRQPGTEAKVSGGVCADARIERQAGEVVVVAQVGAAPARSSGRRRRGRTRRPQGGAQGARQQGADQLLAPGVGDQHLQLTVGAEAAVRRVDVKERRDDRPARQLK